MSKPTHILIVEDQKADFDLARHELGKAVKDCVFEQVETRQGFLDALRTFQPDVILSDFSMPGFDGLSALKLTRERAPLTPFIIWTGSMSEDVAVECMKAGANNYILKENLKRLGPAVVHAVEERQLLLERRQTEQRLHESEERYRTFIEQSSDGLAIADEDGVVIEWNQALSKILGLPHEQALGMSLWDVQLMLTPPEKRTRLNAQDLRSLFLDMLKTGTSPYFEKAIEEEIQTKSGERKFIQQISFPIRTARGFRVGSFIRDITDRRQAEQKVLESEKRFRSLIENSLDNISLLAADGTLLWENPSVNRTLGYGQDTFVNRNLFELMHPNDIGWTRDLFARVAEAPGSQERGIFQLKHEDGTWRWIEATATNMLSEPSVGAVVVNYRDITERKLAEAELQEVRELFQKTFHLSPVATTLSRVSDRSIVDVNKAMEELLGYTRSELVGRPTMDFDYWVDGNERQQMFAALLQHGHVKNYEFSFRNKQHETGRAILSAEFIEQKGEKYALTTFINITERKRAEIEIQQRTDDLQLINAINEAVIHGKGLNEIVNLLSKELKRIFSVNGSTIYMLNPDGNTLTMQQYNLPPEITRNIEKVIGSTIPLVQIPIQEGGFFQKILRSRNGVISSDPAQIMKWMDEFVETSFLPSAVRPVIRTFIPQIFKILNIKSTIMVPLILEGKTIGLLDISSSGLFTENDLKRIENISRQLTAAIQRQQSIEQVQRSQAFLQSVQNALSASIAILDENGEIVQVNSAWRKFGEQNGLLHPEYCIGLNYLDICDSATGPEAGGAQLAARGIREVITGHRHEFEFEYPCHSPEEKRWFILRITKFDDGEHIWVVLAHENITERKKVDEAFKETNEQFRTLFEASPDAILLIEPQDEWHIVGCNTAACQMNGYTRDELIGQSIGILNLSPGLPAERSKYLEKIRASNILRYEDKHRRKDGTIFPIEVSTSLITVGGREMVLGIDRDITERKQAEAEVRKANEKYRNIFENALEAIHQTTPEGRYLTANPATARILGYASSEELLAEVTDLNRQFYVDPARREVFKTLMEEYGIVSGFESEVYRKDGSTIWISENVRAIRDEKGNLLYYEGTTQEITERKQAETKINELLTFNEKILNNSPVGILAYNRAGDCIFANQTAASIVGTDVEHLRVQNYHQIASWKTSGLYELAENAMKTSDALVSDIHIATTFGRSAWLTAHCVKFRQNEEDNLLLLVSDVTQRKQAEAAERDQRTLAEALRDTAEMLNSTLDYGEVLDHILNAVGKVVPHDAASIMLIEKNVAYIARLQGYAERGLDAKIAKLEFPVTETVNLQHMLATRQPLVIPDTHSFPGWQILPATEWVHSNVGAPITISGEVAGFILLDSATSGFFTETHAERLKAFASQAAIAIQNARLLQQAQQEIAERKQAEEKLRKSESRYRTVVENQTEFIVRWNADGVRTFINDAYCRYYGLTTTEALTTEFLPLVYPADRPAVEEKISRLLTGTVNVETDIHRVIRPDGSIGWQEWTDRAIHDQNGQVIEFQSIGRDITERKQAEEELRISEERFRQLATNIQEVFWITDAITGVDLYLSPAYESIWGRSPEEQYKDQHVFMEYILPEDRPLVSHTMEIQKKGKSTEMEYRIRRPDGSVRWVWDRAFPIFDEAGQVVRLAGIAADITERKQVQEKLSESENRYRGLFENLVIGFALHEIITDEEGRPVDYIFLEINPMFEKLTGIRARDVIGRRVSEILPQVENERFVPIYGKVALTGEPVHLEEFSKDLNKYYEINAYSPQRGQFAVTFIDITERKRSEQEINRHLAEMEALYENGLAVGQLLNPREIGERIIETFARYLSWHHVAIRLLQPGSDTLELIAFNQPGMSDEERYDIENRFQSMISQVGRGLSGWVVQTGEPLRTGNVHTHVQYVDTHIGIQSGLYMPLKVGDHIIGVISVESEAPDAFTLQDERLLATLASQAAIAFENARLYQTNQQERERFSDLFENSPVATWLEDFSAVIVWMDDLRMQGIINLKDHLETHPDQYKLGVSHIQILDVNHAAVVMNGARSKEELIEKVHGLMTDEMPSHVLINELDLIWKGYTSFGFEMTSTKLDGSIITGIQRIYIPSTNNEPDYSRVIVTSTDITERMNVEKQLRTSEVHYRELADSITDIFFELDQDLRYSHWNKASEMLTGLSAEYAIGKSMQDVFGESAEQTRIGTIYKDVLDTHHSRTFETTLPVNGQPRTFEINAYPSTRGVAVVAKDVTERKLSESLMQKRFELMEYSSEHGLEELMQRALNEVSEWTHSAIGFFQLIKDDQVTPSLQVWSTDTFQHFHSSQLEEMHKPADQAGLWAEAMHQRRAVIHNDFASLIGKKGLPEDHAPVIRELVLPIIRNEKIVAVIGIGNKPQDYTRGDLEITERFADYAWDIIERKQMVIEIAEERNLLAKRVEERTSDLSRANSNLARALRVKDEFLANMSHELRTPLNAILGLSESLSEQTAGPLNEKQQKYLNTISESGHHLLSLINDILDLAKIEAGQIILDINKVDVNLVAQASLRMVRQLAQKKNLEISSEIDDKLGLMWADERRLKQMIVNLLSNAVKFTPEGGRLGLRVSGDQDENKVSFTVWDTGIGIKPSDFERLFQPFVQLDSGLARESSGTGLGLALVSQMARLHGGSVIVESEAGSGSRFTITLPWEPALTPDVVERMKITGKFRTVRPGEVQQTILLVEDTQEVVMMIKDYLEIAGYKVATAQDGLDGITQAKYSHPDLILMDVQMPRMDGLEATKKLRQDPEFKYTPIIALTALAMPNDRERCLAAGMDEYLSKPVNLRGLVKLIQSYLSMREEKTRPR